MGNHMQGIYKAAQQANSILNIFIWVVLVLPVFHVQAAQIPAEANATGSPISLKAAIELALKNNHQIKAFEYGVSASREDIGIAKSDMLPKVAFEEGFSRTNVPSNVFASKLNQGRLTSADFAGAPQSFNDPGYLNNWQTMISVEQPLFTKKSSLNTAITKEESAAQMQELDRKREQIVARVMHAFLMTQTAKDMLKVAQNSVGDSNEHLRVTKVRVENNIGLVSDTLRATTALKEAQQRLVTAQKNYDLARRSLGMLLGVRSSFDIDGNSPEFTVRDFEYYSSIAMSRSDLKAMQHRLAGANTNIDLATAGYLPTVGVRAAYELDDHDTPLGSEGSSVLGGVFLRWNLFDGNRTWHERTKARFAMRQIRENMLELENAISYGVYEAWLAVNESKKNAELAQSALDSAGEGVRLVQNRYENSLSPLTDLLDSQAMLDNARAGLVEKNNEYRRAVTDLLFQSGTILKDFNIESDGKQP